MVYVYPYIRANHDLDIKLSLKSVLLADPTAEIFTIGDRVTEADCIKHKKTLNHRGCDVTDKILTFAQEIGGDFIYMNKDFFKSFTLCVPASSNNVQTFPAFVPIFSNISFLFLNE